MPSTEFYDQAADLDVEQPRTSAPIERWSAAPVERRATNPVTGHGVECECRFCPAGQLAWYEARAAVTLADNKPAVPGPRKPNALVDQAVPIAALLMVFTVCALVLLPVVVPLMTSVTLLIGVAVLGLAVIVVGLGFVAWFGRSLVGSNTTNRR